MVSANILGLALMATSALGAAIMTPRDGNPNHVNYYSDARCKNWAGQWDAQGGTYQNTDIDVGGQFVGSVILLTDFSQFDSLQVNGHDLATLGGLCPFDGSGPILIDANGNACYVVNQNVNKVTLYTAICDVVGF
ncbi:hypothetical protein BGZ63DRAFT_435329 [Mariannaea sp. PMI_226]|nr:hypothetical protein BGZ63DRAFT_435329 [Mariannaea sp. PMI_226]